MKVCPTELRDVLLVEPVVFEDARGFFMETFHSAKLRDGGLRPEFVQENHSCSRYGTLRGLHYQKPHPQGKLLRVIRGEVYDVAVDLRVASPRFARWIGVTLSERNRRQLYVPPGFAHGFCVTSPTAEVVYKCTDFYHPECEHVIRWDDPELAIDWPVRDAILSEKDRRGLPFREAAYFDA